MSRPVSMIASILMIISFFSAGPAIAKNGQTDQSLREGETRQTMDPNMFTHPVIKKAYQVAKDVPWVLDSIYCFCFCKESPAFRHKSLLSCYVDTHAAQ